MKPKAWMLAAILLCCLLAGCKRSNVAQNFTGAIEDWNAGGHPESHSETEIVEYTSGAFGPALGFELTAYPDDAALKPDKIYTIGDWFGQLEYRPAADRLLVVRVARADGKSLSTSYQESHNRSPEELTIDGIGVSITYGEDGCALVRWTRGDFQYLVHSNRRQGRPSDTELAALVKGLDSKFVN